MFAPLLITKRATDGSMALWQYLPDRNEIGQALLGTLDPVQDELAPEALREGDTAVLWNLDTGTTAAPGCRRSSCSERRCRRTRGTGCDSRCTRGRSLHKSARAATCPWAFSRG